MEAAEIEREFERSVNDVHAKQTTAMESVSEELREANRTMAAVPELRQKELALLESIRDSLANGTEK